MARRPRTIPAGMPQHVVQRGNNRQICFAAEDDYATYALWLSEAAEIFRVQVHAWVFMTNHIHLLATPLKEAALSSMMQHLGRRYVRYFNSTYRRTGTLWEGRFKSCLVQSEQYLLACQRYIEMNPVKAGMVSHPSQYHWSSYSAHALGTDPALWTPHEQYLILGKTPNERQQNYIELFKNSLPNERIQQSLNQGLALGNDRFREEIEQLTGVRQQLLKPGRKRKER